MSFTFSDTGSGFDAVDGLQLLYRNNNSSTSQTLTTVSPGVSYPASSATTGDITFSSAGVFADGTWTIRAVAHDRAGNASNILQWTFRVDSTPPDLNSTILYNDYLWNGTTSLWVNVREFLPDNSAGVGVDGSSIVAQVVSGGTPYVLDKNWGGFTATFTWPTGTPIPQGSATFEIAARDLNGTLGSKSWPISIDSVAPGEPLNVHPEKSFVHTRWPNFLWDDAIDPSPGSGVDGYWVQLDEVGGGNIVPAQLGAWGEMKSWGLHDYADPPLTPDKTYRFSVWAKDNAGNTGPIATTDVIIDTYLPSLSGGSPSNGAWLSSGNVNLQFNFQDPGALPGGLDPTLTSLSYRNVNSSITSSVPASSLTQPAQGSATGSVSYSTSLVDGQWTATAQAYDMAGNVASYSWTFKIDSTPPGFSNFFPATGSRWDGVSELRLNIIDPTPSDGSASSWVDGANLSAQLRDSDGNTFPFDLVWSPSVARLTLRVGATPKNGLVTVEVSARDVAGNSATTDASWQLTLDNAAPQAPTGLNTVSPTNNNLPTFTWTDAIDPVPGTGIANYWIKLERVTGGTVTGPFTIGLVNSWTKPAAGPLSDDDYRFSVWAQDLTGNQGPAAQVDVLVDTVAPWLSSGSPTWWRQTGTAVVMQVNFSDGRAGLDPSRTVFRYHNANSSEAVTVTPASLNQPAAGTKSGTISYQTDLGDGTWTLEVQVYDLAGNASTSYTWSFHVDSHAPTYSNPIPAHGGAIRPSDYIKLDIVDPPAPDGSAGMGVNTPTGQLRDGLGNVVALSGPGLTGSTYSFGLPGGLADGAYTVEMTIRDGLGNTAVPPSPWQISVDFSAPGAPGNVATSSPTTNTTPTFTWTAATDSGSGVAKYRVQVSRYLGPVVIPATDVGVVTTWTVPGSTPLSSGKYTFSVWAVDGVGFTGAPGTVTVIVDTTGPGLSSGWPTTRLNSLSGNRGYMQLSVYDNETGLDPSRTNFSYHNADSSTAVTVPSASLNQPGAGTTGGTISYTTALADGTWTVSVQAWDVIGNASAPLQWSFQNETKGPSISNLSPASRTVWNWGDPVTARISDPAAPDGTPGSGVDPANIVARVYDPDGNVITSLTLQAWDPATSTATFTVPNGVAEPTVARVDINFWANDLAANTGFGDSVEVIIHDDPPTRPSAITTSNPTNSATPTFTWWGETSAATAIQEFQVEAYSGDTLVKGPFVVTKQGQVSTWTLPQALEVEGEYEIRVWSVTTSGKKSLDYASATFILDMTPPGLQIIEPVEAATLDVAGASNVLATTSDAARAEVVVDNGDPMEVQLRGQLIIHFLSVPPSDPNMAHVVTIRVWDSAGNMTEKSVTFQVTGIRRGFGFGRFRFPSAPK